MPLPQDIDAAAALMTRFAQRAGPDSAGPARRYLWTDAFAVCNSQGLADAGAGDHWRGLALETLDRVHLELARFRDDDPQRLAARPARHGQRRTPDPLRAADRQAAAGARPGRPVRRALEWERDGQYFHYLTRWMHALDQLARRHGEVRFNRWARELADIAHRAFTHTRAGGKRMHWKMSTDLSRPLVPSMGQHDPLDGLVTALAMQSTAALLGDAGGPDLADACGDYEAMLADANLITSDPLGLGGLLMDALRLWQLTHEGVTGHGHRLEQVLEAALLGLRHYSAPQRTPAEARLGFRELGLAIGLAAVEELHRVDGASSTRRSRTGSLIAALGEYLPLRHAINDFWQEPAHRQARSWTGHLDINEVMLATSLAPAGWLLRPAMDESRSAS